MLTLPQEGELGLSKRILPIQFASPMTTYAYKKTGRFLFFFLLLERHQSKLDKKILLLIKKEYTK